MLKGAASGVLVDYKGITVEEDTKLRKELREAGVIYTVEKNSLLRFAMKNVGLDSLTDVLEGTTARITSYNVCYTKLLRPHDVSNYIFKQRIVCTAKN